MSPNQTAHGWQAQTTAHELRTEERVKGALKDLFSHAATPVFDNYSDALASGKPFLEARRLQRRGLTRADANSHGWRMFMQTPNAPAGCTFPMAESPTILPSAAC